MVKCWRWECPIKNCEHQYKKKHKVLSHGNARSNGIKHLELLHNLHGVEPIMVKVKEKELNENIEYKM